MHNIRLTDHEIETIQKKFKESFGPKDHLWIFGSRVNPHARGGDIDLYIEIDPSQSQENNFEKKILFITKIIVILGDQKIDVVLNEQNGLHLPIYDLAKKEGILLV